MLEMRFYCVIFCVLYFCFGWLLFFLGDLLLYMARFRHFFLGWQSHLLCYFVCFFLKLWCFFLCFVVVFSGAQHHAGKHTIKTPFPRWEGTKKIPAIDASVVPAAQVHPCCCATNTAQRACMIIGCRNRSWLVS